MVGRMRWLAVLVPALVIGLIELLSDTILDPYLPFGLDTLVVMAVVVVLTAVCAWVAFGRIDRLTADLRARNAEVEAGARAASALHQVGLAIASEADLDAVLQATVDNAKRLLGTDIAMLVLVRTNGEPVLRATSGSATAFDRAGGQPGDDLHRFVHEERVHFLLGAPLRRGDETVGTLAVGSRARRQVGVDAVETLASLASQAAIAIENDRLQAELRDLAVRGERERIARELHDGLAQVLGYVNTKSQAVEELLAAGRVPEARSQLTELAVAARSIYVDVRETILGLSSPVAPAGNLVAALRAYGRRFAEASKLAVRVEATEAVLRANLDPAIEDEAFRIVRESLTNIRKHAAARRVAIRLSADDGQLVVEIEDDGRGFDPGAATSGGGRPSLGLTGMRERAAAVGGHVEWRTAPGSGTTVRLTIPIETVPGPATPADPITAPATR